MQFNISWLAEVLMEKPAGYPPAIEMTGRGSQTYITWKFKFLWMDREALFLMPSGLRLIIRWVINWVDYQILERVFVVLEESGDWAHSCSRPLRYQMCCA